MTFPAMPSDLPVDDPVPVVETERLVLRRHRREDFPSCAARWADPEVARFISPSPASAEEAWARFLRYPGHWGVMGFGYWAVEEKASGRCVGDVGFADYRRAIVPPLAGPEIGWVLETAVAGRGYATEAVRAAVAWGDRHFGEAPTTCIIVPEHARSIRVAEKAGYRDVGLAAYKGREVMVFERIRAVGAGRQGTTSTSTT